MWLVRLVVGCFGGFAAWLGGFLGFSFWVLDFGFLVCSLMVRAVGFVGWCVGVSWVSYGL